MKSLLNIQNSSAVILIALLYACSGKPENKTEKLETLKKEQIELTKKIDALQKEISSYDQKLEEKEASACTV